MLFEGCLHRMEFVVCRQAFDGHDGGAVGLQGQHGAGFDRFAVDVNNAGSALARVAADMGSGEAQLLSQEVHQKGAGFDLTARRLAVDGHCYAGHAALLISCDCCVETHFCAWISDRNVS